MVVHLPDKRAIVVDAKASTAAYLEAQQTEDRDAADEAMYRHASALRKQVDDLAKKRYAEKIEGALPFVVMFIPGDQFLATALETNPKLVEHAMANQIAIATPASLISILWAVANGWQRYRVAQDADAILRSGEELLDRIDTFMGYYDDVGGALDRAVEAFNKAVRSTIRGLVVERQRFAQLVKGKDDDFSIAPIDRTTIRSLK